MLRRKRAFKFPVLKLKLPPERFPTLEIKVDVHVYFWSGLLHLQLLPRLSGFIYAITGKLTVFQPELECLPFLPFCTGLIRGIRDSGPPPHNIGAWRLCHQRTSEQDTEQY